jgi:hypothetical protein
MRAAVYSLLAVLTLYVVGRQCLVHYFDSQREFESAVVEASLTNGTGVKMANFLALREGMQADYVAMLLGSGQEVSRAGSLRTVQYSDGPRCITVGYQNDRLVSKVQSGL